MIQRPMPSRSAPRKTFARTAVSLVLAASVGTAHAVAASDETVVLILHAEGTTIYQRNPTPGGERMWEAREEIATLLQDGKTVGRHYAGPLSTSTGAAAGACSSHVARAELKGSPVDQMPGDAPPWIWNVLRHDGHPPHQHRGRRGASDAARPAHFSVPYRADYEFLRPAD